jgi:phosphoserine aminotransferase
VLTEKQIVHNFNSGPSILPKEVYEQASQAILDFNGSGLSILELGHRTEMFEAVMEESRSLVKELMQLDDNHDVLFLHGGATTQFMQVPMNLLSDVGSAAYTETGTGAIKRSSEVVRNVSIAGLSKATNYTTMPKRLMLIRSTYLLFAPMKRLLGTQ